MNANDFAKCWKQERDYLLELYSSGQEETAVSALIDKMALSTDQKEQMKQVLGQVLTDTFYTLLLGLDGSASIGGVQESFKIYDEEENLISDCGELETKAWEHFHE